MAADVAPGLLRAEGLGGFAFLRWLGHDGAAWQRLVGEARERRAAGLSRLKAAAPGQTVSGSDHDPRAVRVAQACVEHAGLSGAVAISQRELVELRAPAARGLLAANAPYGERLGRRDDAEALTRLLGEKLRAGFGGWHAAVLAGSPYQAQMIGVPVKRDTTLHNGPLECTLAFYDVDEGGAAAGAAAASAADAPRSARAAVRSSAAAAPAPAPAPSEPATPAPEAPPAPEARPPQTRPAGMLTGGAEQFANRLHKNVRRLSRQLRRDDITCYRLYDADLPDYNLVIDVYGDWVHVQEYAPPAEIDPGKVRRRLEDALAVIGSVLDVPPDRVVLKERRRQRGAMQYEGRASGGDFLTVKEDGLTYLVNLHDYLDTGLFLDQRLTRRLVRTLTGGRRFLNLFAYTGTMTVAALAGGSPASTTVDLSSTYLEWARRNLEANGFSAELELSGAATQGRPAPTGIATPSAADGLPALGGRRKEHVRPHLARPSHVLELEEDGPRHFRRAARPRGSHPHDCAAPPGAGRHPPVRHESPRLQARPRRAGRLDGQGSFACHAAVRLRARRQPTSRVQPQAQPLRPRRELPRAPLVQSQGGALCGHEKIG